MRPPRSFKRVLIVDEDWGVLDLVARQVLEPLGYATAAARDAEGAIRQAQNFEPDLIIASLTLPGLSGKDLIVGLRSRGIETPILVTASEGMEADAIQAFRLGARDYLVKPLREAELAAAVEHALDENRLRAERQELADQLISSNRQLEQRVRELTTLFSIGKAVTSLTSQPQLLAKLVDESVTVTEADMGWISLFDEVQLSLMLRAQRGLPPPAATKLHQTWNDGLSSLVMKSAAAVALHGENLEQFELFEHAKSAMVSPIKVHDQAIGVIGVARKGTRPFEQREEAMLAAVADYASISLVNVRLFQALASRAQKLEKVLHDRKHETRVESAWLKDVNQRLGTISEQLALLVKTSPGAKEKTALTVISDQVRELIKDVADVAADQPKDSARAALETP